MKNARIMKKLIYTLSLLMILPVLWAQQVNEIQPPTEDEVVVGAIGGTVDVSALGGAVYSIPIQVPEGMGGIQPNLSIVYNSQSGNGLLGWGWNLGGLSAITRVGQTNYHDGKVTGVSLDYHDRFALDGQRLMVLDGATYGSNNAEYRTEVDGMSKIVSYTESDINGPKYFKVFTADGLIMEYGNAVNARIVHNNSVDAPTVVIWLLNRVEDRDGNYMVYNYLIDHNNHNYKLDNIQYCANSNVTDVGMTDRGTKYGIDFHYYENRVDKECVTIGNHVLYQPWLLKDISIYHWSQPLSKYEFEYEENSGQLNSCYFYNRLKKIHYEYEDAAVIPTLIEWDNCPTEINNPSNPYCHDFYLTHVDFNDLQGTFLNNVKFSGDFNGDGFSDVIVVGQANSDNNNDERIVDSALEKSVVRGMRIYLNEGHNKSNENVGSSNFRIAEFTIFGQQTNTINLTNVNWIYVCDFNGDGLDDIVTFGQHSSYFGTQKTVTVEALKSVILGDGTWTLERILFDDNSVSACWFMYIGALQSATLLTGDFCGRNRDDLIVARNSGHSRRFYYLSYDEERNQFYSSESAADWKGVTYATCDYDGDGKTEVWFADEGQPGKLVKLYLNSDGQYTYYQIRQCFDSNCRLFTGDFNGDGNADFLAYHAGRQVEGWEIVLGGAETTDFSFDVSDAMVNFAGGGDPGNYSYDFETRETNEDMKYYLGVFDIDGDGKSDIVVRDNNNTILLFSPIRKTYSMGSFARIKTYDNISISFNGERTYGICVGNFLGQENLAILHNKTLLSIPQHSIYYNVSKVTDGMGNRVSFDYNYLVHNPMKSDNNYNVDNIGQNLEFELYTIPLPLKAVRTMSSYNINLPTQAQTVDSLSYSNLIVHRKGKGLLGFGGTTRDKWLVIPTSKDSQWEKHQSRIERLFDYLAMKEHRSLVLNSESIYKYSDDGEEVKTLSTNYRYLKGLCERDMNSLGIKVFTPLTVGVITDEYELLGDRGHLRRRITENEYDGQSLANGTVVYSNIVRVKETHQGTDSGQPTLVANCEFRTTTRTEYETILNSSNLWVPNRPHSVFTSSTRRTLGYLDSKLLTVYSYDNDKPYLPKFVNTYPSGVENNTDPLAMTAYYTYYSTGRMKDESHYPVVGRSEDGFKTMYEYSLDHRFLTKKTEEYDLTHTNDYETHYDYDNVYGNLITTTDCNGYSTYYENTDHLGLTVRSYKRNNDVNQSRIPGTETVSALRWLTGSDYQGYGEGLSTASYFSWEQSSGGSETLTIYDALGRELRTVSHGLPENGIDKVIYQDTKYDSWGRLYKVSEPYFRGTPFAQQKWTTYTYGDFDRIEVLYSPSYTVGEQTIEPYTQYDYDGLTTTITTGVDNNALTHVTRTTLNAMGWVESNVEVIDENGTENETTYGYNANGSLAWTKVNNAEATIVSIVYDNAGNRIRINDPDYGQVNNQYNAFGQLIRTISPKEDITDYEYDNLGRIKRCIETDNNNVNQPDRITVWNYSETAGSKGLLLNITLREGESEKQTVAYNYDGQHYNRLTSTTETLLGTPYTTAYSYDDQSGFPLRVKEVTYPSGYAIEKGYDATTGNVTEIRHNNQLLWKTHEANALGQITHYEMGNGVHSYYQYDDRHLLSAQQASKNGNTIQNFGYSYDIFGNLAARTEDKFAMPNTETFTYDYLNRLTTVTLNGSVSSDIAYDAFGRILSKEADGQTVFSGAQYNTYDQYNNLKPHAISSATIAENPITYPSLDISYTMFDKVNCLKQYDDNENLLSQVGYQYGYDHERIQMTHGNTYEKVYLGNCELITQNGNSQWNTFISGPLGVFAAVTNNGTTESLRYIYKDHLGSWTTITDDAGTILQEMSFDAWGNIRIPGLWTNGSYSGLILYDRGFTGHEHLFSFGLINMNGRMYDPVMSSFLSVDNYVQRPDFSQSFNRYAYCLNNPLRYTDPDGEWFLTGGVGFGKLKDGYGLTSLSVGVNFGFWGVGLNLGFDNDGISSVGVYGELGPHVGCAGANLTLSVGYDFRHSTLTGSLSANYGISLGGSCNLGVGVTGLYGYGLSTGQSSFGFGANIGASVHGDIWGIGLGGSYSRYNGHNSFGFGFSGFREMPMEVYDFGVKDNPQSKKDYCVPGALEEASRSLGIDASADFWAKSRISIVEDGGMIYISPENMSDIVNMVNQSGFATSELIPVTPESLIKAHNSGQKVIAATQYKEGERYVAHGVNVRKLEVYSNTYRVYFTETSPVRQVPVYVNNLFEYGFCTFGLKH